MDSSLQRDNMVAAGREALDEEMKKRGYDPADIETRNLIRLLSSYTQEQLIALACQREAVHPAWQVPMDEELERRGLTARNLQPSDAGSAGGRKRIELAGVSQFFLRARNYEIFLLFTVLYCAVALLASSGNFQPPHSVKDIGQPIFLAVVLAEILILSFVGWQWCIGWFLNRLANPALAMRMTFFEFAVAFPPIYGVFFFVLMFASNPRLPYFIIPFHFLAMFCLFYDIYFVSKSLATVELARPVSFYDYAGPFFLLWLAPLGVLVIQPRINRLYESQLIQSQN